LSAFSTASGPSGSSEKTAYQVSPRFWAARARLDSGFFLPANNDSPSAAEGTLVVTEAWLRGVVRDAAGDIFDDGTTPQKEATDGTSDARTRVGASLAASRHAAEMLMQAQFGDFTEGDLVVHVQYGIARFRGLVTVKLMDISGDFLALEYAGADKVYVPVHKFNLVQKYVGASRNDDSVLDSLKKGDWEKRKQRAKADAEKLAKELLEHQARRAMTPGHAFGKTGEDWMSFCSAFPYDETPDQLKAVSEIMGDMARPKAMDRLLVGDVGFGKTEVAFRAAFRCVLDGKQVAWLVPTTVLAHQHFRSALERFKGFGAEIEVIDRAVTAGAQSKVLERVAQGKVDILIGTHRILSKDVAFRDLGLLVVDEEQRFGVLQKEKIKQMSYGVDVLTMTATPIPRTLQMAMIGLRELSLLTTPPKARLAVKTFVCPHDEAIIQTAISQELARGGQVFYVHNRVEDLEAVEGYLKALVPQARICVGHGKMSQKELDSTIIKFLEGQYDLLLCTTIIESGIDMPGVNTILVQNADFFGLAQLYQLRGRVGRRSTRGYAYFLTSGGLRDEDEGARRLDILKEHQDLGSGFVIASHDLEMRGSGSVLGDDQSGRVGEVGLETYSQMLDDAIRQLGGMKVAINREVEIQLPLNTQIPEDYIENARERLRVYRRFFGSRTEEALGALIAECEDRFGPLPETVKNLSELARLRRWLVTINALSLTVGDECTELRLSKDVLQAGDDDSAEQLFKRILDVCNRHMKGVRLTPDGKLLLNLRKRHFQPQNVESALKELKRLLSLLAGEAYEVSSG
jgi:transcription-repair coupling factor (superfamily II helicase)